MSHRLQRGVSLIEALVAFAIMAFGMMAVVGMQGTMRGNADMARQRAEAVRLAQDSLEEWRGFSLIATSANRTAYQDIDGVTTRTVVGTNATYTVSRRALAKAAVAGTVSPEGRGVVVEVSWVDRTNQAQLVRLASSVSGLAPELGASLVIATSPDPAVTPLNRNRAIPRSAVPVQVSGCPGCSGYLPPGQTGGGDRIAWIFNNRTAEITLCTTPASSTAQLISATITCGPNKALLISGFVRQLEVGDSLPNGALDPRGPEREFLIRVEATSPTSADIPCFQDLPLPTNNAVAYACAMPITTNTPSWSGRVSFRLPSVSATFDDFSNSESEDDDDELKICRYSGTPAAYTNQAAALTNQNFLIMESGNGNDAYLCPTGTPTTVFHRPSS